MTRLDEVTLNTTVTFVVEECCVCGVQWGMTKATQNYYRKYGNKVTFYCPAGHGQAYGTSIIDEAKDLKKALEQERKRADDLLTQLKNKSTELDNKSKELENSSILLANAERRDKRKPCPHCGRKYKHLRAHINKMHADVVEIPEGQNG